MQKTRLEFIRGVDYADHVLRYYPYGNYSYDVINTGPAKPGLPIKGMASANRLSHFGPRNSLGGIGSTNYQGLDIAFSTGTKVLACESGTVTTAGGYGGLGNCKVYNIKKELLNVGRIIVKSNCGNEIPMYDLERTICDLIRSRNSIEIQEFNSVLKSYVSGKDKDLNRLMEYAKLFRVDKVIRKYMEVLL